MEVVEAVALEDTEEVVAVGAAAVAVGVVAVDMEEVLEEASAVEVVEASVVVAEEA